MAGGSIAALDRENGTTPARRAISCSPSCQCMASAARHGMAISSATLDHISALNLVEVSAVQGAVAGVFSVSYRSYKRANLFFLSSSHSLRRSR